MYMGMLINFVVVVDIRFPSIAVRRIAIVCSEHLKKFVILTVQPEVHKFTALRNKKPLESPNCSLISFFLLLYL